MNQRRIHPTHPVILSGACGAKNPRAKHLNQTRSVSISSAKHVKSTRGVSVLLLALLLIATIAPATTAQDTAAEWPTLLIQTGDGLPTGAFYADVEPGERGQIEINLAVDAGDPVDVTTAIANAVSPPNGGFSLAGADEPLTTPAAWLDLGGDPLTLETGETAARTIDIAVPANTEPGQYVAAFTLTATDPVPILGADGAGQIARATAAIAITVPGEFESGFDLGDPTFVGTATGGLIQVPVENTGTVPVHPQGTLALETADGEEVAAIPVAMGAVFAGSETVVEIPFAELPPAGDYRLALDLTDTDTRASANLSDVAIVIPEPPPGSRDPEPFEASPVAANITFDRVSIQAEGTPLQSVAVEVDVANVGNPIPSATLTLEVTRNGQLVEDVVIAESVALADGVTGFTTTYAPEGGYSSGLWSFRVRLDAIAPDGTATLIIRSGTVAKIDVP